MLTNDIYKLTESNPTFPLSDESLSAGGSPPPLDNLAGLSKLNLDGDMEMNNGVEESVVAPVASVVPLVSLSFVSSFPASGPTAASSVRNPVDVINHYLTMLSDMVSYVELDNEAGQKHINEVSMKVEELNKLISSYKHSVKLVNDRVADSIKSIMHERSLSTGIALSKKDSPKFQLKSTAVKYFPGEEAFDSVFHLLRNFEKVVGSAAQDVELMWRNYLPLTIPYEYDKWLKQQLVKCCTWREVGVELVKKFNNPLLRLNARSAVQSAAMQDGETVEGHNNRFSRSCA
ncbi:hypothetical protein [Parasitella parasitica]|uniref:Uncharacterized protein n=1 Tax=Parasitella parasitica TaxID=35722 RepID=A0A0B7N5Y6_9FUNG|nr:hypothetical protein [Parasitella parasitica]